jgi:hypothetical protein
MAQVLVLTRQDGTTEEAHVGSPFLAVLFEDTFHRMPDGARDAGWMAFYDRHDRPPVDNEELMDWLRQFIGLESVEYQPPGPTVTADPPTEVLDFSLD